MILTVEGQSSKGSPPLQDPPRLFQFPSLPWNSKDFYPCKTEEVRAWLKIRVDFWEQIMDVYSLCEVYAGGKAYLHRYKTA